MFSWHALLIAVFVASGSAQVQPPAIVANNPGWARVQALIEWHGVQSQTAKIAEVWAKSGGEQCRASLVDIGIKPDAAIEICAASNPQRGAATVQADKNGPGPRSTSAETPATARPKAPSLTPKQVASVTDVAQETGGTRGVQGVVAPSGASPLTNELSLIHI